MLLIEGNQVLQCMHTGWDVLQIREVVIDTSLI